MDYQEKIKEFEPWFHNIHLPNGIQTKPDHFLGDFPNFKWKELANAIPKDLKGWNILDVGCNAGFYSIELAKRGAKVTGIDIDKHYLEQAEWVTQEYGLNNQISFEQKQIYDLANEKKTYDMVWFMGVFYHLRYPLLALDIVSTKCTNLLVFQTLMLPGNDVEQNTGDRHIHDRKDLFKKGWPKMSFIEHRFSGDPTNWWFPNHAGVLSMLRTSGFKVIDQPLDETYICQKDHENPAVINTWNRSEYLSAIQRDWIKEVKDKTAKD